MLNVSILVYNTMMLHFTKADLLITLIILCMYWPWDTSPTPIVCDQRPQNIVTYFSRIKMNISLIYAIITIKHCFQCINVPKDMAD